ncbi:MAG: ABC transporter permease subunit [Phycisphaerales bacterium]|nr:MAG: ABC transporter permease subunit [Phycisphaerales bacterium]
MTDAPANRVHRYQRWDGELNKNRWTWLAMVVAGVRLALKDRKTRSLVTTITMVVLGACIVLYVLSLLELLAGTEQGKAIAEFVHAFLGVDVSEVSRIAEFRESLWRVFFLLIIKIEMFWVLLIVALVGPRLIASDLKHCALPIYFAKPVTPLTYVTSKWLVVAVFIALVTFIPNLLSLIVGVLITGGLHTWAQTASLGLDLVLSGLSVCLVGGAIVLALSSLSSDHRYVAVAWLAVCLLPVFGQTILNNLLPPESTTGWLGCVSLRDNIMTVTDWLFGMREALESSDLPAEAFTNALLKPVKPICAATVLAAWTLAALVLSYRRVVKFSQTAANV